MSILAAAVLALQSHGNLALSIANCAPTGEARVSMDAATTPYANLRVAKNAFSHGHLQTKRQHRLFGNL
jgi:hypothetical protein